MKQNLFILLLILPVLLVIPIGAETDEDPVVTIQILSKQVRLLKTGSLQKISIMLNNNAVIRDETGGLCNVKTLICDVHGNVFDVHADSRLLGKQGRLTIASQSGDGVVAVNLDGESRSYPLPMTISYGNNDIHVHVRERLSRYVVDSSLAEFSSDLWKEKEAILALAHLIRARYFLAGKNPHHGEADFCDLTHCQVYRGRIKSPLCLTDDWVIDHDRLQHTLFFHSRCGGRTRGPGVFGSSAGASGGVRDWLYREGTPLCSSRDSMWERSIGSDELSRIMFPGSKHDTGGIMELSYAADLVKIHAAPGSRVATLPVETFRLKINRVKGWNFIRSNNFTVSEQIIDGTKHFQFRGRGLGHGAGLCQHGAMALSRMGYNRYEILEHYYPDLELKMRSSKTGESPYLSYCLFDSSTGKVISSNAGPGFLKRKVPPGSLFKVIVSLYLAAERPDIFSEYTYDCVGKNVNDPNLPDHCWKMKGHGTVKVEDAIPNSCNLYFASLYRTISEKKFRAFYREFCASMEIRSSLPEVSTEKQWAELLAGLDFRFSLSIADCIKLASYCYCVNEGHGHALAGMNHPYRYKVKIFQALKETFLRGTALERSKRSGSSCNYLPLEQAAHGNGELQELWGKTATVIDGTNRPLSYGLFMGGDGTRGVIVVVRKANGNMAARWARMILLQKHYNGG